MAKNPEVRPKWRIGAILGALAFLAGMGMAIVCGAVPDWRDSGVVVLILVILGIVVGLFNITGREVVPFLIAAIALVVVGLAGGSFSALDDIVDGLGRALDAIVNLIAVFMVPAAVVNAVRVVVQLARPGEAG